MSTLEVLASRVDNNLKTKQEVVLDPATILLVLSIIKELIVLLQGCNKTSEQAVTVAAYPEREHQAAIKKAIRNKLGWWGNIRHGKALYNAILNKGQQISTSEMRDVYGECGTVEYRVGKNNL